MFTGGSSLSLVIGQLADGKTRYVAYRDSPTTELLQEALGGGSKVAWLTHLIPGRESMDYEHNRASLAMTRRVLQIRNRPERANHAPLGLVPTVAEDTAHGAAEERELAELQRLLTSGPCSKRSVAPAGKTASVDIS